MRVCVCVAVPKKAEDFDPVNDVPGHTFRPTLLVCDINAHPTDVARICLPLIALLPEGAPILITLKFFGTGRDRGDAVEEVVRDVWSGCVCVCVCVCVLHAFF